MEAEGKPRLRILWTPLILWFIWRLAFACGQHNWWWADDASFWALVALCGWDRFEFRDRKAK
jgi:hypothetical protein